VARGEEVSDSDSEDEADKFLSKNARKKQQAKRRKNSKKKDSKKRADERVKTQRKD